jgi:hypothetical protein
VLTLKNTWLLTTVDSFSDLVAQGEAPWRELYARWARAGGATAHEVSLMEESFGWLPQALCNGRVVEGKCLLCWVHKPSRRATAAPDHPNARLVALDLLSPSRKRL